MATKPKGHELVDESRATRRRSVLLIDPNVKFDDGSVVSSEVSVVKAKPINEEAKFQHLNFPMGLKLQEIPQQKEATLSKIDQETRDEIADALTGLPGELNLDLRTSAKYFGNNARSQFFERQQFMNRQCNKTNYSQEQELSKLYFDNEKTSETAYVPFGPVRRIGGGDFDSCDNSVVSGETNSRTSFSSRFKPRSEASLRNETVMLQTSAERSGDLMHLRGLNSHSDDESDYIGLGSVNHELSALSVTDSIRRLSFSAGTKPPAPSSNKALSGKGISRVNSGSPTPMSTGSGNSKKNRKGSSSNTPFMTASQLEEEELEEGDNESVADSADEKDDDHHVVTAPPVDAPEPTRNEKSAAALLAEPVNADDLDEPVVKPKKPSLAKKVFGSQQAKSPLVDQMILASQSAKVSAATRVRSAAAQDRVSKNRSAAVIKPQPVVEPLPPVVKKKQRPKTAVPKATPKPVVVAPPPTSTPQIDVYSSMLLENMLAKKKVKLNNDDNGDNESKASSVKVVRRKRTDEELSVASLETVSTIGMFIESALSRQKESTGNLSLRESRNLARSRTLWGKENLTRDGKYFKPSGRRREKKMSSVLDMNGVPEFFSDDSDSEGTGGEEASGSAADFSRGTITSPRTKYIAGCMKEKLNPRASLVVRKNLTKELNLQHHGMGNAMAKLLAESIQGLPFIQSINIADNMLDDEGMGPIILAAVGIQSLLELNLSMNEIGPVSAKALFDYLVSSTCPLKRLVLKNADVDDFECARFIEAIKQNSSLLELDLSNNKIGSAENLNTVMPDLVTGGEAIADLLRLPDCHLKSLKLDWNQIRLDGAIDLAQSVAVNKTLTYLDLSFNSLSTDGGITLGMSILENNSLETLILESNSLDSVACFTICAGVIENRGLKKVVLDGNPIGEQGMKALMLVPMIAGNRVKVSAARCNVSIRDSKCWFDFVKLIRDYDLNMENGFERAIAIVLLHLIAGHHSYVFSDFIHVTAAKGKQSIKTKNIDLMQIASLERSEYFDKKQRTVLKGLQRVKAAASNIMLAIQLFQETDEDGSGELDKDELGALMKRMGLKMSDKRLTEIMNKFDVDCGGKIEIHEFLMLLKDQHQEAIGRIKELIESPVMALRSDRKKRFLPPDHGTLKITVKDGFARKEMYRIMSSCDKDYIDEVAKDIGGGSSASAMISGSLQGTKLRLDEGLAVATTMLSDAPDKVAVIKKMVTQMNNSDDCRQLITGVIESDRNEMLRLKRDMGAALRPILGNPNGYYVLDLSKPMDRMCLEKLLELSATNAVKRSTKSKLGYARVGDLSQKGNWSSFRNETFNGVPITINAAFATPIPLYGKLDFDFSGGVRATRDALVLSDLRVVKLLVTHFLLPPHEAAIAIFKLHTNEREAEKTLGCCGVNYTECPMERARLIGEHIETFYNNITLRMKQFEESLEKESSTAVDPVTGQLLDLFEKDKHPVSTVLNEFLYRKEMKAAAKAAAKLAIPNKRYSTATKAAIPTRATTAAHEKDSDSDKSSSQSGTDSSDEDEDEDEEEEEDDEHSGSALKAMKAKNNDDDGEEGEDGEESDGEENQNWQKEFEAMKKAVMKPKEEPPKVGQTFPRRVNIAHQENHLQMPEPDDFLEKFGQILESPMNHIGAKAHKIVDMLDDLFARSWIYARHLALIVEVCTKHCYIKQTKYFGTYRVDLIIALFARVIDLHNFEFVLDILSPFEVACLICRLGYLNIYNPCKPEGSFELDLSRREERVVAKTLCCLATNEPGDNWIFQTFRWMRSMESMPGWELTQPWLTEEGMPMRGLLNVTYYSGEGKGKKGCKPYVIFRKALLNLVLINEDEIVSEGMRSKPPAHITPGDRAFQKHISLWENYLAPENVDPNRKR